MNKFIIVSLGIILLSSLAVAEDWAVDLSTPQGEEGWGIDIPIPIISTPINYSFVYVNASDYWDNLDTPSDIPESIYWYNHTTIVYNNWNDIWSSTFNSTYDLYAYNHTQAVYDLWNAIWSKDTQKKADGYYLYNDTDTIYFNESILNQTILSYLADVNLTEVYDYIDNVNSSLYNYITNETIRLDLRIDALNNSILNINQSLTDMINNLTDYDLLPAGIYLYNDSSYFYVNETALNSTIRNLAEINEYEEILTCTTISGQCSNTSSVSIDFLITQLTITPTTNTTNYKFEATRSDGDIIDRDRVTHRGVWDIYKNYALFNDTVNMNITSSTIDELFTMRIKYVDNFRP